MTLPRRYPVNRQVLKKIQKTIAPVEGETYLVNRNPRNLEFLRIARKPHGYGMDVHKQSFWYKVNLIPSGQYVTSQLVHFEKGPIVQASTSEWAIKKQLYRTTDVSAYSNLAKVFAQRCLEAGFIEMRCDFKFTRGEKIRKFVKILKSSGLLLHEWEHIRPQIQVNHYVGRREKPYGDWEEH